MDIINSKEKDLIIGNSKITDSDFQKICKLVESIKNGKDFELNDQALTFANELSNFIFYYPIIRDEKYREFAEAAKRISSAKYAYYKKSSTFKENFTKIIMNQFNKHHVDQNLDHAEKIQKVKNSNKMVKYIGELYNQEFFTNENLSYFLLSLKKNCEISKSKVSFDCLSSLIPIVNEKAKTESKKFKHNIHTAAIKQILTEYETQGFDHLKKNFKDMEIMTIEAVNKTINKKNKFSKVSATASKSIRKIFETILSGSVSLMKCVQQAHQISIIYPDSFENEMLQLCGDYAKKFIETNDVESINTMCVIIFKFIGKLYAYEAISSDAVKGTFNFLSKYDNTLCKQLNDTLINAIYEKVNELNDDVLKPLIPDEFQVMQSDIDSEVEENGIDESMEEVEESQNQQQVASSIPKRTISPETSNNRHLSIVSVNENSAEPIDKFRELLNKLCLTNVAYILREASQIRFVTGEESVKDISTVIVDQAINKHAIIKAFVQVAVKLPETIIPNFNSSLMRKHIKSVVSSKIIKCSEKEALGYSQLVKELHAANFYDRFDIIILLESFTDHFNNDRTALPALLKFVKEFEEIICSKKLSKNMRIKLNNIGQFLSLRMSEEIHADSKENIEAALKILKGDNAKSQKDKENKYENDSDEMSSYSYDGNNNNYVISIVENSAQETSAKTTVALMPTSSSASSNSTEQMSTSTTTTNISKPVVKTTTPPPSQSLPKNTLTNANNIQLAPANPNIQYVPLNSNAPMITQIVLPNLNLPPPRMFIPPPFLSQAQQQQSAMNFSSPPPPIKNPVISQSPHRSLPINTSNIFDNRQNGFDGNDNATESSISISSEILEVGNESEDFYDTLSNAESIKGIDFENFNENESAYSSLKENRININEEDRFKHIFSTHFNGDKDEVEKFAEIFIKRGMKCKNSGYIKLIEVIKEGLNGRFGLYESFITVLEYKVFEFIKMLPNDNTTFETAKDREKSLRLILLTGEMYNYGLMKNATIIMCLEKLFNDIGSKHQITLFHQLIKISLDKMIENGMENVCKNFFDNLSKRIEAIQNVEDRNLLSWEIFVTMKVLLYRTQQAKYKCPIKYFKMILSNLNEEDVAFKVNAFIANSTFNKQQITEIVEMYLTASKSSFKTSLFVKLGYLLQHIRACDTGEFTFKKYLESKAHNDIKICLTDINDNLKMMDLLKWVTFIGDLYHGNVASIYLVLCALEMLIEKEVFNKKIVDCINALLRKVGFKIDEESILILDKFFLYFNHIVKNENSYRSSIYSDLIELRLKKWKILEEQKDMEMIAELLGKLNDKNLMQIALVISGLIYKSPEIFKSFNKMLWKFILMNPEMILKYAKLSSGIASTYQKFSNSFMMFLKERNETFKKIHKENGMFPDGVRKKFASVTLFVGYLYAFNFATDHDLCLWMMPIFTKHLTIEESTELTITIGPKINDNCNNNELKGFLGIVEFNMRENLFSTIKTVKDDLLELSFMKL